ncbi:ATP-binding protein [Silvanigrella aquatica]|uniref:histidine kinase n=1 Tax=Silvanigrella aquatica TaxID=1915309 RepID=A0A1L4D005_9BACT|nr:ATP-binding protein [Silvanigrella aquatica]APJ03528.1 hypothetical protein AXG55_06245 [Silvanigrella aquatica]
MSIKNLYKNVIQVFLCHGLPDENKAKMTWLIRLRWMAITAQFIALYFALKMEWIHPPYVSLYIITICNLGILNICSQYLSNKFSNISDYIILFQLLCDLSAITFLLLLTGGVWNPFVQIIFLNVSLGALLLKGKMAFLFYLFTISCVLFLHSPSLIPPAISTFPMTSQILLPAQIIVCSAIFVFTHWLSYSLRLQKKFSDRLQNEKNRIDKLRALGALSAGFSHEFATPLNTIKLRVSRFTRKNNFEDNEDIKTILKAIQQCENAIKKMNYSNLTDQDNYFEEKNINDLIHKILESWQTNERRVSLNIDEKAKKIVCSIPVLAFTKAFIDILDNAEQANAMKSFNDNKMSVYLNLENSFLSLSVEDQGLGWPDIVKKYAGEPFVTTKEGGVGLGLYNGFTFASAVGGQLLLSHNKYGGATAQFLIPVFKKGNLYE